MMNRGTPISGNLQMSIESWLAKRYSRDSEFLDLFLISI